MYEKGNLGIKYEKFFQVTLIYVPKVLCSREKEWQGYLNLLKNSTFILLSLQLLYGNNSGNKITLHSSGKSEKL